MIVRFSPTSAKSELETAATSLQEAKDNLDKATDKADLCSLFSKRLKHLSDTLFLLLHVRVNIEVEGCCNVGMTEQYAYSLVVAVAFYAACGKAVA